MSHIHEKLDFTVEVFIVHKDKVLLRKHDKYKIWLSVGGHIEPDEDPNQAALREVKEEVGLDVELFDNRKEKPPQDDTHDLIPPRFVNRHHINEHHEHVTFVYFATSETDMIVASAIEQSEELKWFTKVEVSDQKYALKPNIRFYAEKALTELT